MLKMARVFADSRTKPLVERVNDFFKENSHIIKDDIVSIEVGDFLDEQYQTAYIFYEENIWTAIAMELIRQEAK